MPKTRAARQRLTVAELTQPVPTIQTTAGRQNFANSYAGTFSLPAAARPWAETAPRVSFARALLPTQIVANRQACKSSQCEDNRVGVVGDDRLADVRSLCCSQASIDLDCPMDALAKAVSVRDTSGTHHAHTHGAHPISFMDWFLVGGTAAAAGIGVWYGMRNYAAAKQTQTVLGRIIGRTVDRRDALAGPSREAPGTLPQRQARRNLAARLSCLEHARGLQGFSRWHGGALQVFNGATMLGGVVVPWLAPVATLGLMAYCGLQARRFVMVDRPRAKVTLPSTYAVQGEVARAGVQEFHDMQKHRRALFWKAALAHGTYGVGAALLALGAIVSGASVFWLPGLVLLGLGMAAVTWSGKTWADEIFTLNSDAQLDREHLGRKESILRQIGMLAAERTMARDVANQVRGHRTALRALLRAMTAPLEWLPGWGAAAERWRHRQRVAAYRVHDATLLPAMMARCARIHIKALQEERAAQQAKQARCHPADHAALRNTEQLLDAWLAVEHERTRMCAEAATSVGDMAETTLSFLAARHIEEDVIGSLWLSLSAMRQTHPWWQAAANREPRFNAVMWLDKLKAGDIAALDTWQLLCSALIDHIVNHAPVRQNERIGALVDHLAARITLRRSHSA